MKKLKIGNITLENPIILAPMVDVTDLPFRLLCKNQGASLTFTEMLYASQLIHENQKTFNLIKFTEEERPLGIQITGNNIKEIEKTIPHLKPYDIVDLNCGCPSKKITGNKAGSFLLNNPEKIASYVKLLKSEGFTVTVKIRLGFKENNSLEVAKAVEGAGADALTIHARLSTDTRSTPAKWEEIKKIKSSVKIPVIANGDIFSGADAEKVFKETNCDGIMIARGAIGDPLIFKRILKFLKKGKETEFNYGENLKQFQEYIKLADEYDVFELGHIKYTGGKFLRGFEGAAKFREEFSRLKTRQEILEFSDKITTIK